MLLKRPLFFSVLFFGAFGAFAGTPKEDVNRDLLLNIATAYDPLSKCVNEWLASGHAPKEQIPESISKQDDFPLFVAEAKDILGTSHPTVVLADAADVTPASRAKYLMAGLGAYAAAISDGDNFAKRIDRQRAVALVMINIASVSNGHCVPSQNLTYWMKEASHANH